MSTPSGVKNDQYEEEEIENIDSSDEEETLLRIMIQEIEKSHILLITPMWEEILYEITCDLGT